MIHRLLRVSLLALPLAVAACAGVRPSAATAVATSEDASSATDDFARRTAEWHARRLERLTAPDGWLTLVALAWLAPGSNRVGSDPSASVSYAGLPRPCIGTLEVVERRVRFEPEDGVELRGRPADGWLRSDADGEPTVLELGTIRFHVIERGGRLAVRMKDASAPARTEFEGIERYPADPAWRIVADFVPADEGVTVEADSVIGAVYTLDVAGYARFERDGHTVSLVLPAAADGGIDAVMFGDETNGAGTYAGGRYLVVEAAADGKTVVLDFNRAYGPPCAFTPFATCSYPVPANRLPFAVTAGERQDATH